MKLFGSASGIVPVRTASSKSSTLVPNQQAGGTVPTREVEPNHRPVSCVNEHKEEGIVPVSSLCDRSKEAMFDQEPRAEGIVPINSRSKRLMVIHSEEIEHSDNGLALHVSMLHADA